MSDAVVPPTDITIGAIADGVAVVTLARPEATGFDLRYTGTMMPPEKDWREFTEVLSRRDLATLMSTAWR